MIRALPREVAAEQQAAILQALPGDRVLQSNTLATVTTNCLIVRSSQNRSRTIIPIVHLAGIGTAKTTYPGLLVISLACFLISAAAYFSKQEGGASIPAAILGTLFLLAYLANRRVAVSFRTHSDKTLTSEGSTREAAALIKAIRSVQAATIGRDHNEMAAQSSRGRLRYFGAKRGSARMRVNVGVQREDKVSPAAPPALDRLAR